MKEQIIAFAKAIVLLSACALQLTAGSNNLQIDLTKGSTVLPSQSSVKGGAWDGGWTVTNGGQQLLIDLGGNISKGYAEVDITVSKPVTAPDTKVNYFCVSQVNHNSHYSNGSKAYVRSGRGKYAFSRFKAYYKAFNRSEYEGNIGGVGDWKIDGNTVHRVRISWDSKSATAHTPPGTKTASFGSFGPIRFIYIGSFNYPDAIPGMRYKSLKIVDEAGSNINANLPTVSMHTASLNIKPIAPQSSTKLVFGIRNTTISGNPALRIYAAHGRVLTAAMLSGNLSHIGLMNK